MDVVRFSLKRNNVIDRELVEDLLVADILGSCNMCLHERLGSLDQLLSFLFLFPA